MTTKTITGTITTGYTLSAKYSALAITPTGEIVGVAGVYRGAGRPGGDGGTALTTVSPATITAAGRLIGAAGGAGGAATATGIAQIGGAGGAGLALQGGGVAVNTGAIIGGAGGAGGVDGAGGFGTLGGDGGAGGAGVSLAVAGSVSNGGQIEGGAGGAGGAGPAQGRAGLNGDGVLLSVYGGSVDNSKATAQISGGIGVYAGGSASVANSGTIHGSDDAGIDLQAGGAVDNTTLSAMISSSYVGVYAYGSTSVSNNGTIEGSRDIGLYLRAGGAVDNAAATALISGQFGLVTAGATTLTNNGTISGDTFGVYLWAGADSLVNAARGQISGGSVGVEVFGSDADPATLANFGAIMGAGGVAVSLASADDRLIVEKGSTWIGAVEGGRGTLELARAAGTITGLGAAGSVSGAESMRFSGFALYDIDALGSWTLTGANTLAAGQTLANAGIVTGTLGLGSASDRIILEAGGLFRGAVHGGHGTLELAAGAGKLSGLGRTFAGFGAYAIDAGGTWTLTGVNTQTAALTNAGALILANKAALTISGAIANDGEISLAGTTAATRIIVGAVGASLSGGGSVVLGAGAFNMILGAVTTAPLTNVDDTITGGGLVGDARMELVNDAAAVINQTGPFAMTIATGIRTIGNAGTIEASGAGGLTIASAIANTGALVANGADITLDGAVSGAGGAFIDDATLDAAAAFSQNVTFSGTTGDLILADATGYAGSISGFSQSGETTLDLGDIGFVSAGEATFSGTAAGGVLSVTDGTHTARISLVGDYVGSAFTASSDGHGGVSIVDPAPAPLALIAAMSTLGSQAPAAAPQVTSPAAAPGIGMSLVHP